MSNKQRHRLAGSAVFGVAAAALLASTAAPAMAAEASIDLPKTSVSVQVADKPVAVSAKVPVAKAAMKLANVENDEGTDSIDPAPIDPPIDPGPIDPDPTDPPIDPGPIDPTPIDPPVEPTDPPVDPDPTDPPVEPTEPPVGPVEPPVGPITPPVGPVAPPVTIPPASGGGGTTKPVVPVAPNKPAPDGVKQPESIKKETTPLQPTGVTNSGAIKTPVKHAQRVAVKTPSGNIQRAVIPAGATNVKQYIPSNAVLINTGLGAQSVADKDAEFWSIVAGTTLLTGAGAGLLVARRGRRAKA